MQLKLALPVPDPSRADLTETRPKYLQAWLDRLPIANLHESANALLLSLSAQNRQALADDTRLKLLELYRDTVHKLVGAIRQQISGMAHPLAEKPHQLATMARELLVELASGYKIVLHAGSARLLGFRGKPDPALVMQRILSAHSYILTTCYEGYAAVPAGLWSEMHQIYRYALHHNLQENHAALSPASVSQLYRRCLLIATADPYRLTQGEVAKVLDLLRLFGDRAQIHTPASQPMQTSGLFLIQSDADQPPLVLTRQMGTVDPAKDFLFHTLELALLLRQLLARLKAGATATELGLPAYADETAYQGLLQRLASNWSCASVRHFNRRNSAYDEVELCTGIHAIHGYLTAENGVSTDISTPLSSHDEISIGTVSVVGRNLRNEAGTTRWNVVNDSANGLALHKKSLAGVNLKVGEIVAVRSQAQTAWNIGVVRWLRNTPADHIELGLQMLSPNPKPVWVRSAAGKIRTNQPALLFPANPALQSAQQLLVPRGIYVPDLPIELTDASIRNVLPAQMRENTFHFDLFEFTEIT